MLPIDIGFGELQPVPVFSPTKFYDCHRTSAHQAGATAWRCTFSLAWLFALNGLRLRRSTRSRPASGGNWLPRRAVVPGSAAMVTLHDLGLKVPDAAAGPLQRGAAHLSYTGDRRDGRPEPASPGWRSTNPRSFHWLTALAGRLRVGPLRAFLAHHGVRRRSSWSTSRR
jgi:hypothetical protein